MQSRHRQITFTVLILLEESDANIEDLLYRITRLWHVRIIIC